MKHFFDIGANVGQTFDYLATLDRDFSAYKFWAFEPSPRHLAALLEKCESVKDRYDVTVCPFGIGGATREEVFFEKDDALGDSFLEWHASDHAPINREGAYHIVSSIVSLPLIIERLTSSKDEIILNIDAEGSEYEMLDTLMGSWAFCDISRVREIWVEWHRVNPIPALTPDKFTAWCQSREIRVVHRGLKNLV